MKPIVLLFNLTCAIAASSTQMTHAKPELVTKGCGLAVGETGRFTMQSILVLDHKRAWHVRLPPAYKPDHAYPVIFRWHGSGGNGLSGGLDIEKFAGNEAIIIAADGLYNTWDPSSSSDELLFEDRYKYIMQGAPPIDVHFFDLMLESASKQYCIDRNRIFSYGFSMGGYFTNLLACERGDVIRASAAIASGPAGNHCKGKAAIWLLHDRDDKVIGIEQGIRMRDKAIARNGCSRDTRNIGNGCVQYQTCDVTPVVWCESKGIGHNIRGDFAPERVWQFFSGLH